MTPKQKYMYIKIDGFPSLPFRKIWLYKYKYRKSSLHRLNVETTLLKINFGNMKFSCKYFLMELE